MRPWLQPGFTHWEAAMFTKWIQNLFSDNQHKCRKPAISQSRLLVVFIFHSHSFNTRRDGLCAGLTKPLVASNFAHFVTNFFHKTKFTFQTLELTAVLNVTPQETKPRKQRGQRFKHASLVNSGTLPSSGINLRAKDASRGCHLLQRTRKLKVFCSFSHHVSVLPLNIIRCIGLFWVHPSVGIISLSWRP